MMKRLILLLAALFFLAGCGSNSYDNSSILSAQMPVPTGTAEAPVSLDTNFTNIQSNFTELYAEQTTQNEALAMIEDWPVLSGGGVSGGISGLELTRASDTNIIVSAGFCRSETNEVWISSALQVVAIPATASTYYSVFAVSDGVVRVSLDHDGDDLPDLYKRWIGFVYVNASSVLTDWSSLGDEVWFSDFDDMTCLPTLTETPTSIPLTGLLPVVKIKSITFGAKGPTGQSGIVYVSTSDSSNIVSTILLESGSTWGSGGDSVLSGLAVNAHISDGSGALAIHSVKIKR